MLCRARVGAAVSAGAWLSLIASARARLLIGSNVASSLLSALATALAAVAAIPIGSTVAVSVGVSVVVAVPLMGAASFVRSGAMASVVRGPLRKVANVCGERVGCRDEGLLRFVGSGGAVPESPEDPAIAVLK